MADDGRQILLLIFLCHWCKNALQILYISLKKAGVTASRNYTLSLEAGEHIVF